MRFFFFFFFPWILAQRFRSRFLLSFQFTDLHYSPSGDNKERPLKWEHALSIFRRRERMSQKMGSSIGRCLVAVGKGLLLCLALGSKPKNVKEDFTKSIHGVWIEAPWGGLVTSFWTIVAFENISVLKSTIVPVQTSIFKIKSKGQWEMISSPFHSGLSAPWFASLLTKIIGFLFPLAPSPPNHRVNAVL